MKCTPSALLIRIGLAWEFDNAQAPKTQGQVDVIGAALVVVGVGY